MSTNTIGSEKRIYSFTLPQSDGESFNQTLKKLKLTLEREFFRSEIQITLKSKSSVSKEPIERQSLNVNKREAFEKNLFANRVGIEKESL